MLSPNMKNNGYSYHLLSTLTKFSQINEARKRNKRIRIGKGQGKTTFICTLHNPIYRKSWGNTHTHTPTGTNKGDFKVTRMGSMYKIHYIPILLTVDKMKSRKQFHSLKFQKRGMFINRFNKTSTHWNTIYC